MADPAVEAAHRAWDINKSPRQGDMIDAAREALKPIREWQEQNRGFSWVTDELLDSLLPLIYSSDEVNQ